MDFKLAYERFCRREKLQNKKDDIVSTNAYLDRKWSGYKEVHHILPKSFGGRNVSSNFVAISSEKHKYAHVLLNLALLQEHNTKALDLLSYTSVDLPMDFILKQRAMREVKISIPISGKKHPHLVLSIPEATKYFCFASRKNFTNKDTFNEVAAHVL